MKPQTQKAQILVVTLFVLMIVAVIVVGVVSVASKDVLQTTADRQYTELYDAAERSIMGMIDVYSNPSVPLNNLTMPANLPAGYTCVPNSATCQENNGNPGAGQYLCTRAEAGIVNQLCIREARDIWEYELAKDDSLVMPLNNYRGQLTMAWIGNSALEFALHYYNTATGTYGVIHDVFDNNSILNSNGGDPFSDPFNNHAFPFQSESAQGIRFTLGNVTGVNANTRLDYLRITSRMRDDAGITLVDVTAQNAGLPNQVRVFDSTSYAQDDNHVFAQAVTQVPLFPQIINILHYGFLTDGSVTKTP